MAVAVQGNLVLMVPLYVDLAAAMEAAVGASVVVVVVVVAGGGDGGDVPSRALCS